MWQILQKKINFQSRDFSNNKRFSSFRRHITILNAYAPNKISTKEHTLKHIQEEFTELKEVDNLIIIVGDLNISFSETEGETDIYANTPKIQKIWIWQLINLTFMEQYIQQQQNTLLFNWHGTVTKTGHTLDSNSHPNKLKRTEIMQVCFQWN